MTRRVPLTGYTIARKMGHVTPPPSARTGSWRNKRKCRKLSPAEADSLFFPGPGGKSNKAKEFCSTCPVQNKCLDEALSFGAAAVGMWAGTTDDERRRMTSFLGLVTAQLDAFLPPEPTAKSRRPKRLSPRENLLGDPLYGIDGPSPEEELRMYGL